jgi:hypothetical protein
MAGSGDRRPGPEAEAPIDAGQGTDVLPREFSEFLVSMAMALHRFAMYPPGHPSLLPAAERLLTLADPCMAGRASLTLGVTATQLLVDGAASSEGHHALVDLARRLHAQQLGAVVLRRGLDLDELTDALATLARDPVRGERPLGLLPARERPGWPHLQLLPLEYGALELADGAFGPGEALSVRELWLALFRSIFQGLEGAGEEGGAAGPEPEPGEISPGPSAGVPDTEGLHAGGPLPTGREVAETLARVAGGADGATPAAAEAEAERERAIVRAFLELVAGLHWQGDAEGQDLRLRAAELLRELDVALLGRIFRRGTDAAGRREVVVRTARAGLASDAVLRVLEGVLAAEDRDLSPPLAALLARLAAGSESDAGSSRSEARSTLRDQLERIVAGWGPDEGNGGPAGEVRWGREPTPDRGEELGRTSPFRLVELAVAVDAPGPALDAALEACLRRGNVAPALALTETAPHDSRAAARIEAFVLTPDRLRSLLSGDDVDEASLRRVVDVLGEGAIEPLFDALATSESRSVRRKIFDRLVAMGARITPIVMEFLGSEAWYVRRNMLALLQRMPVLPPGFSPISHLMHPDSRVRREALPLAFRDPGSREHALELALDDDDDRMVRAALLELQEGLPESVVPTLVRGIVDAGHRAHLRSLAARALGASRAPEARDALAALCTADRGLLSLRRRLAAPSPEFFAALHALARGWRESPEVAWIFEAAGESDDPRVRATLEGRMAGTAESEPARTPSDFDRGAT